MASAIAPGELSGRQREFLCWGPRDAFDDAFTDEAEVHAAWEQHREALLASCPPGRRPWGWRIFDRPEIRWRGYDFERAINWRANVLSLEERATLERQWRGDFFRGRDLKSADVPRELVRRWKAELRRRKEEPAAATAATGSQSV